MSDWALDLVAVFAAGFLAGALLDRWIARRTAARERHVLVTHAVQIAQFAPLPSTANLTSAKTACRDLKRAISDNLATLDPGART